MANRHGPAPWQRPAPPRRTPAQPLSAEEKAEARASAEAAGRRYPNLVDNMRVAAKRVRTPR